MSNPEVDEVLLALQTLRSWFKSEPERGAMVSGEYCLDGCPNHLRADLGRADEVIAKHFNPELKWVPVADDQIRHIWMDPSTGKETWVNPSFYEESGNPVAGDDGDNDGEDLTYLRTEILS
jgi:hypothetical protein